jgi:hypothetical protein
MGMLRQLTRGELLRGVFGENGTLENVTTHQTDIQFRAP